MSAVLGKRGIPGAWDLVPLSDLGQWSGGGTPSKSKKQYWDGGTIPWVSPKDMKTLVIRDSEDHITEEAVASSTAKLIPPNSVLFVTRSGILRHSFPVAVNAVSVTVNQDLKTLTPKEGVLPEYVAWALRAFSQDILNTCSKQGTTVNSIETNSLKAFTIPIAPLEQQKRIVAEIEKQFSRLDEAVANLKRVKANLKRYKAAVLKAAVEGKLTEEWRKKQVEAASRRLDQRQDAAATYDPASKLLDRILAERRAKWEEAELAKLKAKGKAPKNNKWKAKYKEPSAPDSAGMPPLPAGWVAASLEQLTMGDRVICYGILMPKVHVPDGILYVKVKDMKGDNVNVAGLQRTSPVIAAKYDRASLRTGDLLLSIRGTYGRVAEVPPELDGGNITQDTARLATSRFLNTSYIAWFLRSQDAQNYFKRVARGVAVEGVNIGDVRICPVFLPSTDEQCRIASEVDGRAYSGTDQSKFGDSKFGDRPRFSAANSGTDHVFPDHRGPEQIREQIRGQTTFFRIIEAPDVWLIGRTRTAANTKR